MTLVCEHQNGFYFQVKKAILEVATHFPQQPLCNNPLPAHCPVRHPSRPPRTIWGDSERFGTIQGLAAPSPRVAES